MAKECGKPAMMARRRNRRYTTTVCSGSEDAVSAQDRCTLSPPNAICFPGFSKPLTIVCSIPLNRSGQVPLM